MGKTMFAYKIIIFMSIISILCYYLVSNIKVLQIHSTFIVKIFQTIFFPEKKTESQRLAFVAYSLLANPRYR